MPAPQPTICRTVLSAPSQPTRYRAQVEQEGGQPYVTGVYRQRFTLASGRFARVVDGLGFQLVRLTAVVGWRLGPHVSGVAGATAVWIGVSAGSGV